MVFGTSGRLLCGCAALAAAVAGTSACGGPGGEPSRGSPGAGGGAASAASSSTAGGSAASGGSGGAHGDVGPFVGLPCKDDSPCGPGGRCRTDAEDDALFGGGLVHGYCTATCFAASDCGSGNYCVANGAEGLCVQGCTLDVPTLESLNEPLSPKKCHGREDTPCTSFDAWNVVVCLPACGRDEECPAGRRCDLYTGTCTGQPKTGLPVGAHCAGDQTDDPCAGICAAGPTPTDGLCTARCVLGGSEFTDECGGIDVGLCYLAMTVSGPGGLGDLGGCVRPCSTHADCATPLTYCFTFGPPGHAYCIPPAPCTVTADCADTGSTCTSTPAGMACIDLSHGDPSPDGGT